MKTLKFREKLSKLILNDNKDVTWRLFDDKNLKESYIVSLVIWETGKEFEKSKLVKVKEKEFCKLTEEDRIGHEKFSSEEEMYKIYSKYYGKDITHKTKLKIIKFELIK